MSFDRSHIQNTYIYSPSRSTANSDALTSAGVQAQLDENVTPSTMAVAVVCPCAVGAATHQR